MREPRLESELTSRFGRIVWTTLTAYILVMLGAFIVLGELVLVRSSEQTVDVIQSLLGLYADPEGEQTTVAPAMLADQLVGMGDRVAITRTTGQGTGDPMVYYLSPNMPAKRLEGLTKAPAPEEMRQMLLDAIADRARWRFKVMYRPAGDFDIYLLSSRVASLLTFGGLAIVGLAILPLTAIVARRSATRSVAKTLGPLSRVNVETREIQPDDLSRRVTAPTGLHEVTELAESINRMLNRVDGANRALESFTADASHELRTPMTHLRAQAQWCLDQDRTTDEMKDAFAAIQREVDRTTKMVDDLLTIARGANRQLVVDREVFDVRAVVDEVDEIAQAMATGRDVRVRSTTNAEVSAVGDADRTRQILLNLVSNAVRYTQAGEVSLEAHTDNGSVAISVRDTGTGIPDDQIGLIFDRFYRGDKSRSRTLGGVGLGLTIAKLLAELQGGRISVESVVGTGSVFTLWLPAEPEGQSPIQHPSTQGQRRAAPPISPTPPRAG
jgi:signal transduction histidine kinase